MVEEYCWLASLQAETPARGGVKRMLHWVRASSRLQLHVLHAAPVLRLAEQTPHGHVAADHHIAGADAQQCSHAYVLTTSPPPAR